MSAKKIIMIAETPMPEEIIDYESPAPNIPNIETERLILRPMTSGDAADYFAFAGDRDTAYWAGMEPFGSLEDAEFDIYIGNAFEDDPRYGVALKGEDRIIGQISVINDIDADGKRRALVGYLISKEHSRKGYMTEALDAVCRHVFESRPVDYIECEIRKDNIPSRGLAAKCGFIRNPAQKYWRLNHYGKPLDEFVLTRESFQNRIDN